MTVKRIATDGILLALLCVIGMFSIPIGDNIKVSLQFLIVLIIFGICDGLLDKIIIPGCYLGIGFLLPVFAGFASGVSPTFGFVISFCVAGIPFHFLMKLKIGDLHLGKLTIDGYYIRFIIAALVALIVVYFIGTLWLGLYLKINAAKALMIGVVPYIGFDILKIILAAYVVKVVRKQLYKNS